MRVPPVTEAEHILRLEFDYDDAAALVREGGDADARPVFQFGILNNRDTTADKLEASLAARGIDANVELFAVPSIPRGANGKVNRAQLKAELKSAKRISPGA